MPEQQKPARRHHVVSKFYLRRFANPRQQLTRLPLVGKAHLQSINDATVRKDFYTVLADGVEQDNFETQLGLVETEAAAAFTAILRDRTWPPAPEHRAAVSAWIALQYLRGERTRQMVEETERALSKLQVGIATTDRLRGQIGAPADVSDDEIEAARTSMLATADTRPVHRHVHLNAIGRALEESVMSVYSRRPWILVDFEWDILGTSDTPVLLTADPADLEIGRGVGIVSAKELYVPLGSRAALCIGELGGTEPDKRGTGSADFAHFLNERIMYTARQALYHHPDTTPFAGFDLPQPRQQEMDMPHEQINGLIEATARAQGRSSGLSSPAE